MGRVTAERVGDATALVGESAVWDAQDNALWWVDIPAGLIHRHDPFGVDSSWQFGEPVGCLARRDRGGLVLGTRSGFVFFDPDNGIVSPIAAPERERPNSRFNDGTTDSRGRFWAGTMQNGEARTRTSSFWCLNTDLSVTRGPTGLWVTNGLAFAPDGTTIYFSDSDVSAQTIWKAHYEPNTAEIDDPVVFFDARAVAGRPDGATVDADGCYWMAGVGGWQVVRITPGGVIDRIVGLPVERPSRPMFGGPDLSTLYVTTISTRLTPGTEHDQPLAGALLAISGLGAQGLAQTRFAA